MKKRNPNEEKNLYHNNGSNAGLPMLFLSLAREISKQRAFSNYHCKDDLIGEAVLECLLALKSYDNNKPPKPYFSRVIRHAFVRKIKHEQHEMEKINSYISRRCA